MSPSCGVGFTSEQETIGYIHNSSATIALMDIYLAKMVSFYFMYVSILSGYTCAVYGPKEGIALRLRRL